MEQEDDDLWFTPEGVPVPRFTPWIGRNHDPRGWTPARQLGFMRAMTRCGSARAAAAAVGKSVRSAYLLRDKPGAASFAAAWDQAALLGRRLRSISRSTGPCTASACRTSAAAGSPARG